MSTTVPTLTLEGLGYLPPPLINEVRYGSRHTRTAQWRSFSYGLGRYAFTAVNVSDFFDLSELPANVNRSSAPATRVTPAYLFSKAVAKKDPPDDGDRFDKMAFGGDGVAGDFLKKIDPEQESGLNEVPLQSMMDYNLWMGKNYPMLEYPFYGSIAGVYSDSATFAISDKSKVMPQLFIAGGWNGREASGGVGSVNVLNRLDTIDLSLLIQQPFFGNGWNGFPGKMNLEDVFNGEMWQNAPDAVSLTHSSGSARNVRLKVGEVLPAITQCLLYDYLDYDSTPLSLALPCTEETPMLVYVNLDNCVKWVTVVDEVPRTVPATDTTPEQKFVKKTYKLRLKIEGMVNLGTVYPFLHSPRSGKTFSVDCFMRVFLTEGSGTVWENPLRDMGGGLKLETDAVGSGNFKWGDITDKSRQLAYFQVKSGSVSALSGGFDIEANAANLVDPLAFDWTPDDIVLAEIEYEVNADGTLKPPVEGAAKSGKDLGSEFAVLAKDWQVTPVTDSANPFDETAGVSGTTKYYPSAAIWVRIRNNDDEVVDFVPATLSYDNLDGKRTVSSDDMLRIASGSRPIDGTPLLRFSPKLGDADSEIEFNGKFFVDHKGDGDKQVVWEFPTYSANDPRYNWAPEDWYAHAGTDPKGAGWLREVKKFQQEYDPSRIWCDTDIFMQVSNQGYLQSMYELMMIPQVSPLGAWGTMDIYLGRLLERQSVRRYDGVRKLNIRETVNAELMWRTYKGDAFLVRNEYNKDPYIQEELDFREKNEYKKSAVWKLWGTIEDLNFVDSTEGFRVNPYTDITNLFFGALANMPCDWWAAGTNWNDTTGLKNYMKAGDSETKKVKDSYLMNGTAQYRDVSDMARFMMAEFRHDQEDANSATNSSWMQWSDVMDVWNWPMPALQRFDRWHMSVADNEMNNFMNDLMSTERKFMYGYLKGCFANTSQLFLIFVRAQPAEGGSDGRAVALVWRDPASRYSADSAAQYLNTEDPAFAEETWRLKNRNAPPHRTRILFYHQFE